MKTLQNLVLCLLLAAASVQGRLEYLGHNDGNYEAALYFELNATPNPVWSTDLYFDRALIGFMVHNTCTRYTVDPNDPSHYTVLPNGDNCPLPIGPDFHLDFYVRYDYVMPQLVTAEYNGQDIETNYIAPPVTTPRPTFPPPQPGEYHYDELLGMSIEFYEANRCGRLPVNNRISWRNDSFLDDGQLEGVDLTGGYFDAGDHVKFGFPFAWFTTVLNYGMLEAKQGYVSAGQLENGLGVVKWSLDYFIKAHVAPNEFYGQTGEGGPDHGYWGRPEDWHLGPRRSFKITQQVPGSDLAGEAAAAFASGYLVFRDVNATYANILLEHARQLYDFANNYRGKYTDAIPASGFYDSWSGFGDELGWGAAWLYAATGEAKYLTDVQAHYAEFGLGAERPEQFSWDDKRAATHALLAKLTGEAQYLNYATEFCSWLVNDAPRTPKGLVHLDQWGPNRHAANVAFICLATAELVDNGLVRDVYRAFARQQLNYMLGDSGRSFVVGYGNNPPVRPHHRASSCPDRPSPCSYSNGMNNPGPNFQTLYGALVGGPSRDDSYVDDRQDFIHNEVATDYNAGFQSALAFLHQLKTTKQIA